MRTSDLLAQREGTHDRTGGIDLLGGRSGEFRDRWTSIQTDFVDEPQGAVERADELVAEVITAIAERFSAERGALEHRWSEGSVGTEELRVILRSYRDFFERLLDAPSASASEQADQLTMSEDPDTLPDADPDRSTADEPLS